jgi:hypothetical protein
VGTLEIKLGRWRSSKQASKEGHQPRLGSLRIIVINLISYSGFHLIWVTTCIRHVESSSCTARVQMS